MLQGISPGAMMLNAWKFPSENQRRRPRFLIFSACVLVAGLVVVAVLTRTPDTKPDIPKIPAPPARCSAFSVELLQPTSQPLSLKTAGQVAFVPAGATFRASFKPTGTAAPDLTCACYDWDLNGGQWPGDDIWQ